MQEEWRMQATEVMTEFTISYNKDGLRIVKTVGYVHHCAKESTDLLRTEVARLA